MDIDVLKQIGLSEKHAKIYLALLCLGPSSVRALAAECELNRGTTYDALNALKQDGLVQFYQKDTRQTFVAEDPRRLHDMVRTSQEALIAVDKKLEAVVPELQALHNKGGERPLARYYDKTEIVDILSDVLVTCEARGETMYRVYSTKGIRKHLYQDFPDFSQTRLAKNISVHAIAIGEGGELRGLDERKWVKSKQEKPTYILIYPGKTAYISLNGSGEPAGVVIENDGVFETQKIVFDTLWSTL